MPNPNPTALDNHAIEVDAGERFRFGANWSRFLKHLDERRIDHAIASLKQMLGCESLDGRTFLDVGSGSGLFSLAAHRLGARVHSFDFDPQSVACTRRLREMRAAQVGQGNVASTWHVEEGSVLDAAYLASLGTFDIVYSWGVLHHTGSQWAAMDNAGKLVRSGGQLFIAIYNDQGPASRWWTAVKRCYNRHPVTRWPLVFLFTPYFVGLRWLYRQLMGLGDVGRGMSLWYDMIDWLGGYPFEVAKPEQVLRFYRQRGFELRELTTAGGSPGCNEFVFEKTAGLTA